MISNEKLDALLKWADLAASPPVGAWEERVAYEFQAVNLAASEHIHQCDPETIRALVKEVRYWRITSAYREPPVVELRLDTYE